MNDKIHIQNNYQYYYVLVITTYINLNDQICINNLSSTYTNKHLLFLHIPQCTTTQCDSYNMLTHNFNHRLLILIHSIASPTCIHRSVWMPGSQWNVGKNWRGGRPALLLSGARCSRSPWTPWVYRTLFPGGGPGTRFHTAASLALVRGGLRRRWRRW